MTESVFKFHNRLQDIDETVVSMTSAAKDVLSFDALTRFEICLSEALTNLVQHGQNQGATDPSEIRLKKGANGIELLLLDPVGSKAFDPNPHVHALADVAPDAERGRGLGLIWECADSVEYRYQDERNQLLFKIHNRSTKDEETS